MVLWGLVLRGLGRAKLRYFIYVLAAGFSASFAVWSVLHAPQLAPFVLKNQLPSGERDELLLYIGVGVVAAYALWLVAPLVLTRAKDEVEHVLAHVAAQLSLLIPTIFLPALLLPNFGNGYRFLTFFLTLCASGLLYGAVREVQGTKRALAGARVSGLEDAGRNMDEVKGGGEVKGEDEIKVGGEPTRRRWRGVALISLLSLGYGMYFSVFTVSNHNAFHTHAFDLGIFDQVMYHTVQSGKMLFTVVHDPPESFWSVHFSPALYLLTPFYALYQDARTLLVLQSFLLGAGAVVLYALTLHLTGRALLAGALSVSYLLSAALHGVNTFHFHEVALAPLFLLLTLYCLETERLPLFWLFLALSLLIKEDIPLTGAALGLYLLARGRYKLGLAVTVTCTVAFFAIVEVLIPHFGSGNYNLIAGRFGEVVAPGSEGIIGVVKTGLTNPLYVLIYILSNPHKLAYLGYLFVPVLFLPLLAGRAWLAILPALATALLSSFRGQFDIGNQYSAVVIPLVFFLAAKGMSKVPRAHHVGLAVALLASSFLMNYTYGRLPPAELFSTGRRSVVHEPTPFQGRIDEMLALIPPDVSAAATGTFVPHLSTRDTVKMLPGAGEAEVVLMDLRPGANYWPSSREAALGALTKLLESGNYGVRDYDAACCILLERGQKAAGDATDRAKVLEGLP